MPIEAGVDRPSTKPRWLCVGLELWVEGSCLAESCPAVFEACSDAFVCQDSRVRLQWPLCPSVSMVPGMDGGVTGDRV